jgi:pimeloyl-ACP methyl ester carboxylesterase
MIPRSSHYLHSWLLPAVWSVFSLFALHGSTNSPPVAADDQFALHSSGVIGSVLTNDFDPDHDPMSPVVETSPTHGQLFGVTAGSWFYRLTDSTFTGIDSFTYRACDPQQACSNLATVTITIGNQPPVGSSDSYIVHGTTTIGPMLINDSDPDGDVLSYNPLEGPFHGTLFGMTQPDMKRYTPNRAYVGPDSFTYKACDALGLCSSPVTVSLNVANQPPIAANDTYNLSGDGGVIGPLLVNDSDPEGDHIDPSPEVLTFPTHGILLGLEQPDKKLYIPDSGFSGTDTFTYRIRDDLYAFSSPATVTLHVEGAPTPTPTPTPTATPTPPPLPPPPPPSPSPSPTQVEPLIFIPGIAGSKLNEGSRNLWPGVSSIFPPLVANKEALTLDPTLPQANIFAPDVIRAIPIRVLFGQVGEEPFYKPLLDMLAQNGYREYQVRNDPNRRTVEGCDMSQKTDDPATNPNLFVFAYDWRKSNVENADLLKSYVRCVKRFYPESKVNILTHSMGGLVARRYILQNPGQHGVDELITIAAPWLGAPKAINVLETGQFDVPSMVISSELLKQLVYFFKSVHEIMPSRSYFAIDPNVFGERDWDLNGDRRFTSTFNYEQFLNVLDNVRFQKSKPGATNKLFHDNPGQDDWHLDNSGVRYFHLYGVKRVTDTIGKLTAVAKPVCNSDGKCKPDLDFEKSYVKGDGTVPERSATRISGATNLNATNAILKPFPGPKAEAGHTELTQNPKVWAQLLSILSTGQLSQVAKTSSQPKSQRAHHGRKSAGHAGTSSAVDDSRDEAGYYVTVGGVNQIIVTDSAGNSNEPIPDSPFGATLSDVTYDLGLNSVSIVTSTAQDYTLKFASKGEPITIQALRGVGTEAPTQAIRYLDLNLPSGTMASLSLSANGIADLVWDADGDGVYESTISPTASLIGALAIDVNPPTLTTSGEPDHTHVRVTISAQDSESGLGPLRYSLDGTHYQFYAGPFVVDPLQTPVVYAFADDLAANRSGLISYDVPQPPTITAPENLSVNTGAYASGCGVTVSNNALGDPTATSNSQGTVVVSRTGIPSGNFFPEGTTLITYTATDSNGLTTTATQSVTVIDKTPPILSRPENIVVILPLNSTATSAVVHYSIPTATDNCSSSLLVTSLPAPGSGFSVGTTLVVATATDAEGNSSSTSFTVTVMYNFGGFFPPVSNIPVLNSVNAGRAIPIKFSLFGNKGLAVFSAVSNNPGSGPIACDSTATEIDLTETLAAGNSSLSYDFQNDQYTYVWKTDSSWSGTCRQFVMQLNDGGVYRANFKFK